MQVTFGFCLPTLLNCMYLLIRGVRHFSIGSNDIVIQSGVRIGKVFTDSVKSWSIAGQFLEAPLEDFVITANP